MQHNVQVRSGATRLHRTQKGCALLGRLTKTLCVKNSLSRRYQLKYLRVALISCMIIGFGGCSENESGQGTTLSVPTQKDNIIAPIKDQGITGKVCNTEFNIEQAIIENGVLGLKQGKERIADISVEVITFDNEGVSEKTFSSSDSTGSFKPHIRLSIKKEGQNLPDKITLQNEYELLLSFGKKETLGIPFSIRLASLKNGTRIEGKSFATYKNIRVVSGVLDTQFDSFDTLDELAKKYIATKNSETKLGMRFNVSQLNYGEDYPQSGFVGYEITTSLGEQSLVKIQLAKDENGWKVVNQLKVNQIHQAHPVLGHIEGGLRTVEEPKARKVAAQKLETYLNEQVLIENVRATSVNCYLTESAHKASCRAIYGLKVGDKVECHGKNYLLINDENKWKFESDILDTQKVDSITGELVDIKPRFMTC